MVALVYLSQYLNLPLGQGHATEPGVGDSRHPAPVDQLGHLLHHRLVLATLEQDRPQSLECPGHARLPHPPRLQVNVRVPRGTLGSLHHLQGWTVATHLVA